MGEKRGLISFLTVAFLLNGAVPFSLFLVLGLIYSIGSSLQIIALLAALVTGGLAFSASGLLLSRYGSPIGLVLLAVATAAAFLTDASLRVSMVLSIEVFTAFSFFNMSSNALVSYSISRIVMNLRGKPISVRNFLSVGVGSPAVFFVLFFLYAYLDYSYLPLIALSSEIAILCVSALLIGHSVKSWGSEGKVVH